VTRVGKNLRPYVDKARDSALLAVEVYNKPAIAFKSAAYVALMAIAWTSLLHAIFLRKHQRPYYKAGNGRYVKVDGDYKHWELKECVQRFWFNDVNNPVRKNLEFFIPLRNKIEHRHIPELDAAIFGECQALLLNFDALLGGEFGEKRRLRECLTFSLQLFPSGESLAAAVKANKNFKDIKRFVDDFRGAISADVQNSGQFSFKAFLIQVANHQSQDALAIQFVQYDKLSDEQKAEVSRLPALIKLKSVGVVNADLIRAGDVVKAVQGQLGNPKVDRHGKQVAKFNLDTHARCWRRFNIRPPGQAEKPEFTDQRYCSYDKAHGDYLYTPAWVEFLVEKMKVEDEYNALYVVQP
jgi:uncharacterized protein DUF3644